MLSCRHDTIPLTWSQPGAAKLNLTVANRRHLNYPAALISIHPGSVAGTSVSSSRLGNHLVRVCSILASSVPARKQLCCQEYLLNDSSGWYVHRPVSKLDLPPLYRLPTPFLRESAVFVCDGVGFRALVRRFLRDSGLRVTGGPYCNFFVKVVWPHTCEQRFRGLFALVSISMTGCLYREAAKGGILSRHASRHQGPPKA